jgi:hypothetical protein
MYLAMPALFAGQIKTLPHPLSFLAADSESCMTSLSMSDCDYFRKGHAGSCLCLQALPLPFHPIELALHKPQDLEAPRKVLPPSPKMGLIVMEETLDFGNCCHCSVKVSAKAMGPGSPSVRRIFFKSRWLGPFLTRGHEFLACASSSASSILRLFIL